jgi:hypothetical protein
MPSVRTQPITADDLAGLPGLRAAARNRLLDRQPATVFEALCIGDVAHATTRELLKRGVLTDPEGVQHRSLTKEEFERWMHAKDRDRSLVHFP